MEFSKRKGSAFPSIVVRVVKSFFWCKFEACDSCRAVLKNAELNHLFHFESPLFCCVNITLELILEIYVYVCVYLKYILNCTLNNTVGIAIFIQNMCKY